MVPEGLLETEALIVTEVFTPHNDTGMLHRFEIQRKVLKDWTVWENLSLKQHRTHPYMSSLGVSGCSESGFRAEW